MEIFLEHQQKLLQKEFDCELQELEFLQKNYSTKFLQKYGLALAGLRLTGVKSGLGGKEILTLEPLVTGNKLAANQFKTGDVVELNNIGDKAKTAQGQDSNKSKISGIVIRITDYKILISTDQEFPAEWKDICSVVKLANEVSFKRMIKAVVGLKNRASDNNRNNLTQLEHVLLGQTQPAFNSDKNIQKILTGNNDGFYSNSLNDSQKQAVKMSLLASDLALVHGPPGTGKTSTLIEIILQLNAQNLSILVCGPSNISVDNIAEKLVEKKIQCIRVGHPARLLDSVLEKSLDYACRYSESGSIIRDIRKELDENLSKLKKVKHRAEKFKIYEEIKLLRKELKKRESTVISNILDKTPIILSTLNGCASKNLNNRDFDVVIIDEAGQALEAECWIAASKGKKLILAGDHLQLPPTVKSEESNIQGDDYTKTLAKNKPQTRENLPKIEKYLKIGLQYTMFERLIDMYGDKIVKTLTVQYRMHEDIVKFSSTKLYKSQVTSDKNNSEHLLIDLENVGDTDETLIPLVFLDTVSNDEFLESNESNDVTNIKSLLCDNNSKLNTGEVELVKNYVDLLVKSGLKESDIAVISPYNAQVHSIRLLLNSTYPTLEVGSVDGFQGREKEAIIISLVRSNDDGQVGFLSDYRRINVAITRARRHLCIIGNSETLSNRNRFLKELCEYMSDTGELRFP
ncbi:hypothetical protein BB561_001785 [Smittium simulii]|uniref:DNA helicase n=1 Tax=Smittium simulii TaxID=133385 RepID=A0A2T9YT39_9FUNG|nr:hypothetical protein BB561_001785 [Smittium simulii]